MIFVYNDFKEEDYRKNIDILNKEYVYILNNIELTVDFEEFLVNNQINFVLCNKIYNGIDELTSNTSCIDAENYKGNLKYSKELAVDCKSKCFCSVLMPENLGGEKYKKYDDFILYLDPKIVIMERTYNEWKPWEILRFWKRNDYLRKQGIKTIIGIWSESLPWICQKIQYISAKLISRNNLMFYYESKTLPK